MKRISFTKNLYLSVSLLGNISHHIPGHQNSLLFIGCIPVQKKKNRATFSSTLPYKQVSECSREEKLLCRKNTKFTAKIRETENVMHNSQASFLVAVREIHVDSASERPESLPYQCIAFVQ